MSNANLPQAAFPLAQYPPDNYDKSYMRRLVALINQISKSNTQTNTLGTTGGTTSPGPSSGGSGPPGTGGSTTSVSGVSGSATMTVGAVLDGCAVSAPTSITVTGAVVGNPVFVGVSPSLPLGVTAHAKVSAPDTVAIEVWNASGADVVISSALYSVTVFA